jgi:multiple sugar transport system permease protein
VAVTTAEPREQAWSVRRWLGKQSTREAISGYLFILPTFIGYTAFVLGPVCAAIGLSFTDYDGITSAHRNGLANYRELIHDSRLHIVYRNTFVFTIFAVFFNLAIGLALAVLLNRAIPRPILYLYRTVFFFPVLVAHVYIAIIWQFLYSTDIGVINFYLDKIGLGPYPWLSSEHWSLPSVIIMDVWKNAGFAMLVFLAGLQNIPDVYYEAAALDGAGAWRKFRNITLPLLSPTLFLLLVIFSIGALQVFDSIIVLTNGGPGDSSRSVVMYLREIAFESFRMGYASAVAMTLLVVIMCLTLIQFRFSRRWVHYD